jgi:hypothetical protein
MPDAHSNPELYTSVVLAGVRSPGVVTLSGHDRKIGWDIKKAAGQSGASTERTSEDPIEFTASFYLVQDHAIGVDDFAAWPEFRKLIRSTIAGATPKALDIYHPDLAENDIKSVVLANFLGVVRDGKGGETRGVKFLEYRPAKPKKGSPSGSKSKPKKGGIDPNDPNAEALAELARLTDEYQNTPWGKPDPNRERTHTRGGY